MQLGSTIFGGISASKAMKRVRKNVDDQRQRNQDWYNRRVNEDATQRADAQRILSITRDNIRQRNRQATGAQAVTGATEESVAATKAANNSALAEAASQIAVNGDRRKDAVEEQYLQRDAQLQGQLNQMEVDKAKAIGSAVQGVGKAAAGVADTLNEYLPKQEDDGNGNGVG